MGGDEDEERGGDKQRHWKESLLANTRPQKSAAIPCFPVQTGQRGPPKPPPDAGPTEEWGVDTAAAGGD